MSQPTKLGSLSVSTKVPELIKGPMTTQHLMRWSSAIENWHRIHYDRQFAVDHDKLPDLLVNGSWKQHVLVQLLKDWAGPAAWVAALAFQYRSADVCGDTIIAAAEVTGMESAGFATLIHCDISIRNQRDEQSTLGTATVRVPNSDGDVRATRTGLSAPAFPEPGGPHRSGTHVTEQMLAQIGVPGREVEAPEPVDASSIRRMAQAIMDDDPLYFDPDAARRAGYDTVVAPPLFPLHMYRRHPGEPDPLLAAITHPDDDGAGDVITRQGLPALAIDLPRLLNGGNQVNIVDLARVGDVLASVSTITDIKEKVGRTGTFVLVQIDTDYRASNRKALLLRGRQTYVFR